MEEKPNPPKEKKRFLVRPLRTYKDDIATFVKNKRVSTAKIVMAEEDRRHKQTQAATKNSEETKKKKFGLSLSFGLVILGIIIVIVTIYFLVPMKGIIRLYRETH